MTDKLRKYVLPNIPYVFIGWVFLKLGTAYRLAAGSDFAHKLLGLGQTIGAAFADFAPGLALFDWLVGIVGAVAFRLLIYFKSKNAKKFRRDAEYGSARWGNEKDIKPFVDPKFENNMLLTATERLTMNTRPKNPANARNLNFCGIGSSGSGKTRFWLTPQLLQAHSSYVVVDPKGGVLGQVGSFLQKRGYKIKVFNSIDFSKSMHYNPLAYIKTEADILKFVNALISNTKGEGKEGDPFWTKAETLLYCALLGYIIFEGAEEDRNMNTLVDMISGMEVTEDDEDFLNAVDYMFKGLEQRKPNCFAVKQYKKYKLSSGKTAKSILISCGARLAPFDIPQLREIMSYWNNLNKELEATPVNESELPGAESTSQNDILQVGIRKATAGVYDEEGLKFTWSVENIGDYSVSFDKNMIAQIVLNGEDYAFETEAVTLEPGEAYSVDISIPYPVARQDGTNNVKITATTGDTTATYKESFTH